MSKPYEWIKKIPDTIVELDESPLLGHPPEFPWSSFIKKVSQTFEIKNLNITPSEFQWRDVNELFSGMGEPLNPLNFSIAPFEGKLYWAMSKEDIKELMSLLLLKEKGPPEVIEEEYQEGFYHFLALEAIHAVESLEFDSDINLQVIKKAELPSTPMLSMDITIVIESKTINARLFLSPELRQSMAKHYTKKAQEAPFTSSLSEKIEVTLHLEAGSTTITQDDWSKVKPGDFILLDKCTLKPKAQKGKVMITLNGHPFFRGRIKDGNVKILEHPFYNEEK